MCYSWEVQLATSLIVVFSALFYYFRYSRLYRNSKEAWLLPFLRASTAAFLSVGLHQFFEFLSLVTGNPLAYKLGLMVSILAAYFFIRSLEVLSNRNLHSWVALAVISLVGIHLALIPVNFGPGSFYVKHFSAFFWSAAWLFLFIYWHVCAFRVYSEMKDSESRKTLVIYLLALADVSFVLSAVYVLAGYFLFSVNVCTDSPSIWCTFYVVQSVLIPVLLFRLPRLFRRDAVGASLPMGSVFFYLLLSLLVLLLLAFTLPLFGCLSWKWVFP